MSDAHAPWWRAYFDDDFYHLHRHLFDERDSRREVSSVLNLLGLHDGARVLDAPCGWGRHTSLLAEAGMRAFGADLSVPLLRRAGAGERMRERGAREARSRARDARSGPRDASPGDRDDAGTSESDDPARTADAGESRPGDGAAATPAMYAAADLRALPYRSGTFDAVLNLFTSLGLFVDDAEDLAALREARRVLAPGGRLLLESIHRDDVMRDYAERDAWTLPDGTEVRMRRRFDPVTGISRERTRWRTPDGRTGEKRHALRLRTATEIDALLAAAGFGSREYYGSWRGGRLTRKSLHLIVVAG